MSDTIQTYLIKSHNNMDTRINQIVSLGKLYDKSILEKLERIMNQMNIDEL